jgi:Protein of unknown function (DUF5818)
MKRILSMVAMLGLSGLGLNLAAQQTPSTPQAGSMPQQQQADATNPQQSARSFEGKISKAGDKLVLQETSTQTAYQLDDQDKAKQFQGKNVTITATLDSNTNTLHVVDINPTETK